MDLPSKRLIQKANQKKFPQHGNQKKGAGFPMARNSSCYVTTRGTVIDYAIGAHKRKGHRRNLIIKRNYKLH